MRRAGLDTGCGSSDDFQCRRPSAIAAAIYDFSVSIHAADAQKGYTMKYGIAISVLAMLALPGCSMFTEYRAAAAIAKEGVYTAIEDRKAVNDVKADVLLAVPCDASLGAVMRMGDSRKRAILIELCGGPPADSQITVDDIAAVVKALGAQP